jgi:ribosomal protein L29
MKQKLISELRGLSACDLRKEFYLSVRFLASVRSGVRSGVEKNTSLVVFWKKYVAVVSTVMREIVVSS